MSTTYWPAKLTEVNRTILFKLNFWDAGDSALKKFDHILPVFGASKCIIDNLILQNRYWSNAVVASVT